jgi:nitrogen fixation protein
MYEVCEIDMSSEEQKKRQAFSVNIPDDKKEKWAAIAKAHNRPMGWLFIDMVDRMIAANSIHIYGDSQATQPQPVSTNTDDVLTEYVKKSELDNVLTGYVPRDDLDEIFAEKRTELLQNTITRASLEQVLKDHPDRWQFEELKEAVKALEAKVLTPQKTAIKTAQQGGGEYLPVAQFGQRFDIPNLSRDTSAEDVRAMLKERGLDKDWKYVSNKNRFEPLKESVNND